MYDSITISKVQSLRKKGCTIRELARKIGASPDTISHWVKTIELNESARRILLNKRLKYQKRGRLVIEHHRKQLQNQISDSARELIKNFQINNDFAKLCCSLIFWCEGSKNLGSVRFTNSDPILIKLFLELLRKSFKIDEKKLRCLIHLHEYHDEEKQKLFWSKITGIPFKQFSKSYIKFHTGKNKHTDYQGCLAVYYYDSKVAKELTAVYNAFGSSN